MPESSNHTYRVVIASTRHLPNPPTPEVLLALLNKRKAALGKIMVASIGCDVEPGKTLKEVCATEHIPFFEVVMFFNDAALGIYKEAALLARHAALTAWGEEFHIMVSPHRMTNIEDLVEQVQLNRLPMTLYGSYGAIIEPTTKETTRRPL